MTGIDELGEVLDEQNAVLDQLIATADPVARAVTGKEGKQLDKLVQQAHDMLGALTAARQGLEQTLTELPGAIKEARTTLHSLDTVPATLPPTLQKARPVPDDLEQRTGETSELPHHPTPQFNSID